MRASAGSAAMATVVGRVRSRTPPAIATTSPATSTIASHGMWRRLSEKMPRGPPFWPPDRRFPRVRSKPPGELMDLDGTMYGETALLPGSRPPRPPPSRVRRSSPIACPSLALRLHGSHAAGHARPHDLEPAEHLAHAAVDRVNLAGRDAGLLGGDLGELGADRLERCSDAVEHDPDVAHDVG